MSKTYKQDERVYFRLADDKPEGWATVAGVQGFIVIIKPEQPIKDYPYTHLYVVETQIVDPPDNFKTVRDAASFKGTPTVEAEN
jgi:hypothetical protein